MSPHLYRNFIHHHLQLKFDIHNVSKKLVLLMNKSFICVLICFKLLFINPQAVNRFFYYSWVYFTYGTVINLFPVR